MAGKSFSEFIGQFTLSRNSPLRQHALGLRSRGLLSRQSPITVIGDGGIKNCSAQRMKNQAIQTSVGFLEGRDAIYFDGLHHDYEKRTVSFFGEINASLASKYEGSAKWLRYQITFKGVDAISMTELDCYEHELELASSFDRVTEPRLKSRIESCEQFVLATYDHVFELMATGYEFEITNGHEAEQAGGGQAATRAELT